MREIKCRGLDQLTGEWVYGYYVKNEHMGVVTHYMIPDMGQVYANCTKLKPETIGQFTGLKDKNGVDIYKGDIIEFHANYTPMHKPSGYMCGLMEWDDEYCRFFIKVGDVEYDIMNETDEWYYKREVIGNIYENPELIKHS